MSSVVALPAGNGSTGHTTGLPILALSFSRQGNNLLSASKDRTLCLWSVPQNAPSQRLATVQWAHTSNDIAADPRAASAGFAVAQSDGAIQFWTTAGGLAPIHSVNAHAGEVFHVAFSNRGRKIASAGQDNRIVVWDSDTTTRSWEVQLTAIPDAIAFSTKLQGSDSGLLAVCSAGKVKLFDVESGAETGERIASSPIRRAAFQSQSYGGHMVYGCESGEITVARPNGTSVQTIDVHSQPCWIGYAPLGRYFGVTFSNPATGQPTVLQRRPAEQTPFGEPNLQVEMHFSKSSNAISFSGNDHRLATGMVDGGILLWPET